MNLRKVKTLEKIDLSKRHNAFDFITEQGISKIKPNFIKEYYAEFKKSLDKEVKRLKKEGRNFSYEPIYYLVNWEFDEDDWEGEEFEDAEEAIELFKNCLYEKRGVRLSLITLILEDGEGWSNHIVNITTGRPLEETFEEETA